MSVCCFLLFFISVPDDCEGICKERILTLLLTTVKKYNFFPKIFTLKLKKDSEVRNLHICWYSYYLYLRNIPHKHQN